MHEIYYRKSYLFLMYAILLSFISVGIWLIYDGLFVSFPSGGEDYTRRVALKSYRSINVFEAVAGTAILVFCLRVLFKYVDLFVRRGMPAIRMNKEGVWTFMVRGEQKIAWEEIETIQFGHRKICTFFPPLRWILPQLTNFPVMILVFKKPQQMRFSFFDLKSVELRLNGFSEAPNEIVERVSRRKRVHHVSL